MKKQKNLLVLMTLVLIVGLFPCSVSANSAPPPGYFYYEIGDADASAVCADVLIELTPESEGYTALNTSNAEKSGFPSDAPIITYQEEGYMSMSFHYGGSSKDNYIFSEDHLNLITLTDSSRNIGSITPTVKIALLDASGNILKISAPVSVTASDPKKQFARSVRYNASTGEITAEFSAFPYTYSLPLLLLIRLLVSIFIETLIALLFKLRPLYKVILINAVTQVLLITFFLLAPLPYLPALVIGELLVYLIEFIFCLCVYKQYSRRKLFLYTITANTLTLVIGLISDFLGFPLLFIN